jgi:hypothetical protein
LPPSNLSELSHFDQPVSDSRTCLTVKAPVPVTSPVDESTQTEHRIIHKDDQVCTVKV